MHKRQPSKGYGALDKAVKPNPKFSHITSTLNTGCNVNNVRTVTSREYAKRRDEIFFRITKKQLVDLISGYDEEAAQENMNNYDSPTKGPRIVSYSENDVAVDDRPYVIIDIRDAAQYQQCCIRGARSFPFTLMKRDQMLPELYRHRNKEEHLVIVYCDDERISAEAAKFLVDRGTNNTFLVSGGMQELVSDYPEYVEGDIPYPPSPQKMAALRREKERMQRGSRRLNGIGEHDEYVDELMESPARNSAHAYDNRSGGGRGTGGSGRPPMGSARGGGGAGLTASQLQQHEMMTGGHGHGHRGAGSSSSRMGNQTGRGSEAGYSTGSTMSVAGSVISRATARKGKF